MSACVVACLGSQPPLLGSELGSPGVLRPVPGAGRVQAQGHSGPSCVFCTEACLLASLPAPQGCRPWDFPGKSTGVGCHQAIRKKIVVYQVSIPDIFKITSWKQQNSTVPLYLGSKFLSFCFSVQLFILNSSMVELYQSGPLLHLLNFIFNQLVIFKHTQDFNNKLSLMQA